MKKSILIFSSIFLTCFHYGNSTLMLTSMLLAAKTGMMIGKMGVGGLMMMLLAASNQNGHDNNIFGNLGKKRNIRSADNSSSSSLSSNKTAEDILLTERMVRQIDASFDTLTCIPKFVCGMNAEPPSKKTSLLNDYGHLIKVMFERDEGDDQSDEEGDKKAKNSEELRLSLKEDENLEDLVNEQLIDEDPGLLPFVLKDVYNKRVKNHDEDSNDDDISSDDYSGPPIFNHPHPRPHPPPRAPFSPMSSLTSLLPKIETGLGTKRKDSDFDNDPFFAGFRSLNLEKIPIIDTEENVDEKERSGRRMTKREKNAYLKQKFQEQDESDDPVDRYKIATEVGKKLKSKNDCSRVFKKCPYKWEEVTGMVSELTQTIKNHPIINPKGAAAAAAAAATKPEDKVIYLKTYNGANKDQSLVGISTADTTKHGTTLFHDIGNGQVVEISMKMVSKGEALPAPIIEDLGINLKTTEAPKPSTPSPSIEYSDSEIDGIALALENKNKNGSWIKREKKKGAKPLPLLEDTKVLPPTHIEYDDELEDAIPVFIGLDALNPGLPKRPPPGIPPKFQGAKKKPVAKKPEKSKEADDEEEDDDENESEEEEEDDEVDDEQERRIKIKKTSPQKKMQKISTGGLMRRRQPMIFHQQFLNTRNSQGPSHGLRFQQLRNPKDMEIKSESGDSENVKIEEIKLYTQNTTNVALAQDNLNSTMPINI